MKKREILWLLPLLFLLARCTVKEDYIFEESATARIKAYITACEATITKPEYGWKALFEPNKQSLGGYNIVMKFAEDGNVRMVCDFLEDETTSTYSFNESQGAVLCMDTYSALHYLADPRIPRAGVLGVGLEGEFEFVIKEVTADSMVFTGKKWGEPVVFYPAEERDWTGRMAAYREHIEKMAPQEDSPFFRALTMNNTAVNIVYDPPTRTIIYTYSDNVSKEILSASTRVYGTDEGVRLSPEIRVNGVVLDRLRYNQSTRMFEVSTPGVVGALRYSNTPPFPFYKSLNMLRERSTFACTPRIGSLSGNITGILELLLALIGGHSSYMTSELQLGYRNLALAGMKQFRIIWDIDGEGPWFSLFGALSFAAMDDLYYSTSYKLNMEILRDDEDQVRFTWANEKQTDNAQFDTNMSIQAGFAAFRLFITDPAGFTIVPSANERFYLVNLADSRRWLLLSKE
ncbi:MAG: DUF4302 domain-containing protein [Odoribacteraceae bacterium]|jgi:hypothetical protein|nr:DUF4302 domain-containing protein [Odoribacteraceae bacterium]